jgi:hypothetical protein
LRGFTFIQRVGELSRPAPVTLAANQRIEAKTISPSMAGSDGTRKRNRGPQMKLGDAGLIIFHRRAAMTADQFVEFVASVPPEKQVGLRTKLAHLMESARRIRDMHGLNMDPVSQVTTTAAA